MLDKASELEDRLSSLEQQASRTTADQDRKQAEQQTAVTSTAPRWMKVGLGTILAGALPITVVTLTLVIVYNGVGIAINHSPLREAFLLFYFLAHLLPLPLGALVGVSWPGKHLSGYVILGVSAGAIEAIIIWVVVSVMGDLIALGIEDYIAVIATAPLFLSGGLFGDLIERRRKQKASEASVPSAREGLSDLTLLLLQSLGPAFIALFGTTITAVATLMK